MAETAVTRRCYCCDQAGAAYEAHLDHDATPVVLLCDACAIWERDAGSVVWIRTLKVQGRSSSRQMGPVLPPLGRSSG